MPLKEAFTRVENCATDEAYYYRCPKADSGAASSNTDKPSQDPIAEHVRIKPHKQLRLLNLEIVLHEIFLDDHDYDENARAGRANDRVHDDLVAHRIILNVIAEVHAGSRVHEERADQNEQGAGQEHALVAAGIDSLRV